MDSAPHDGTRVLLLVTTPDGKLCPVCGSWDLDKGAKRPKPYWANDLEFKHGRAFSRACKPLGWKRVSLTPPGAIAAQEVARAQA